MYRVIETLWSDGHFADTCTYRVIDGVGNCRCNRHDWRLTHTLSAKGTEIGRDLNQDRGDVRDILAQGECIVHQGGGLQLPVLIVLEALKERPAKSLRHTTVDLSLNCRGIDGTTNILSNYIVKHTHLARFRINSHLRHVGGKHG